MSRTGPYKHPQPSLLISMLHSAHRDHFPPTRFYATHLHFHSEKLATPQLNATNLNYRFMKKIGHFGAYMPMMPLGTKKRHTPAASIPNSLAPQAQNS